MSSEKQSNPLHKLLDFSEVDWERWKCDRTNTAHPLPLAGKEDISHPCDRFLDTSQLLPGASWYS